MSVFSRIIAGEIPGRCVWADDVCGALGTHEPIADGPVRVIPPAAHVHVHVIPARSEEDIVFANARAGLPAEALDAPMERLRQALRQEGWGDFVPEGMHSLR